MMSKFVSATQLDDTQLAWVWVALEQVHLLDHHDGMLIELSKKKKAWPTDKFLQFYNGYGLNRGRPAKIMKIQEKRGDEPAGDNRGTLFQENILDLLPPKVASISEVSEIWKLSRAAVAAAYDAEDENGRSCTSRSFSSATSKYLWFHYPDCWLMYDSLNCKGLRKIQAKDQKVHEDNFIQIFNDFWEFNKGAAEWAAQCTYRHYPYPIRIAEKMLWLIGRGRVKEDLLAFRNSLKLQSLDVIVPPKTPKLV